MNVKNKNDKEIKKGGGLSAKSEKYFSSEF
jgi:hypothetical protein